MPASGPTLDPLPPLPASTRSLPSPNSPARVTAGRLPLRGKSDPVNLLAGNLAPPGPFLKLNFLGKAVE